jgi:Skp family chaperone for outer membrane proteins
MISTALALCMAIQFSATGEVAPTAKIGFVDRDELFKAPRVEKVLKELREQIRTSESEFERKMDRYEQEMRDFELKKIAMDEAAAQEREAELRAMRDEVVDYLRTKKEDLERVREERLREVTDEIRDVVRTIAQENGYTLVLWKSALAYGAREHDLTQIVMKRFLESGGGQ